MTRQCGVISEPFIITLIIISNIKIKRCYIYRAHFHPCLIADTTSFQQTITIRTVSSHTVKVKATVFYKAQCAVFVLTVKAKMNKNLHFSHPIPELS